MRKVICFFGPGQRIAFAKKSGPSFGISEKSISSSRMESIRFQSVRDCRFVFFPFFMVRLSQRNDANGVGAAFGENDYSRAPANRTDSSPALLSVVRSEERRVGKERRS